MRKNSSCGVRWVLLAAFVVDGTALLVLKTGRYQLNTQVKCDVLCLHSLAHPPQTLSAFK